MASTDRAEPFPQLTPSNTSFDTPPERVVSAESNHGASNPSTYSKTSSPRRTRGSSLVKSFIHSNPPLGMWQATGEVGSKIPTLPEIKNGGFSAEGWSHEGQMELRGANPHDTHRRRLARTSSASTRTRKGSATPGMTPMIAEERHEYFSKRGSLSINEPVVEESATQPDQGIGQNSHRYNEKSIQNTPDMADSKQQTTSNNIQESVTHQTSQGPDETGTYPNGYRFPKKHTWTQATSIGLKAFWKFFLTPFGFLVTIYGLNVVGWGAMIFFVLLEAAPAMCHPSCNAINSPRKKWIEIDSQVLNGLFCVTGFGLIPWRFRDFYYLIRWRVFGNQIARRRLAGIYRGWYRLPGSDQLPEDMGPPPSDKKKTSQVPESPHLYTAEQLVAMESNPAIPIPISSMPEPPLTGIRALPSRPWTVDVVVWMYIWNTILQGCLAGVMWGLNRFNRPSWTTGLFISLACITGIVAGIVVFIEGSKVKKMEGIPVHEYDVLESVDDYHERKAKEEAKDAKKHKHDHDHDDQKVVRTEKVKGEHWFTRH